MNIELITWTDRREPEAHVGHDLPSHHVPMVEFQAAERGIDAVTVFKSIRRMKRWLRERGYSSYRRLDHSRFTTS